MPLWGRQWRMRRFGRVARGGGAALGLLSSVTAASPSVAAAVDVVAPAAAGQQAMAVRVVDGGFVAKVCSASPGCVAEGPDAKKYAASALADGAEVELVPLVGGRHVVRVSHRAADASEYVVVLAAPLAGEAPVPKRIFSHWVGRREGLEGERVEWRVAREQTPSGATLSFAQVREDLGICGRETPMRATRLDPTTLERVVAPPLVTIPPEEAARAPSLTAERLESGAPVASPYRVLTARGSSSPNVSRAVDGDRETAWSESLPGIARGEFLTATLDPALAVDALDFVLLPTGAAAEASLVPPKSLLVATPTALYRVAFPKDASDATLRVRFPEPLRTSCVSLVLEDAHLTGHRGEPAVTIAEVAARTALETEAPEALVKRLSGPIDEARAARALLFAAGEAGVRAALDGYDDLPPPARARARDLIDSASCSLKSGFYRGLLVKTDDPNERKVAEDRVRRCSREEGPDALLAAVRAASGEDLNRLARELVTLHPAEAVPALVERLASVDDGTRRVLRQLLGSMAAAKAARPAFEQALEPTAFGALPLVTRIDLLRAVAAELPSYRDGPRSFSAVLAADRSFRTRYLLLEPASHLAPHHVDARKFLEAALVSDASGHVRAEAARSAARVPSLAPRLVAAGRDAEVRVREAALVALTAQGADGRRLPGGAMEIASARLEDEPWTFVRKAAVRLLATLPADARIDARIVEVFTTDDSAEVRGASADALGERGARAYVEELADRVENRYEAPYVRARALLALARLCHRDELDDWTKLAMRSAMPISEEEHQLGLAALTALGRVHPPDLAERLAPLMGPKVPPEVREGARRALADPGSCR